MNKLIPRISGYGDYTRVYAQTHVFKVGVHKVFQWVLFVASVVYGPLQAHCGWLIQTHECYAEPLVNKRY